MATIYNLLDCTLYTTVAIGSSANAAIIAREPSTFGGSEALVYRQSQGGVDGLSLYARSSWNLLNWRAQRAAFVFNVAGYPVTDTGFYFRDQSDGEVLLTIGNGSVSVSGAGVTGTPSALVPQAHNVYEFVWATNGWSVYVNNKQVLSGSWTKTTGTFWNTFSSSFSSIKLIMTRMLVSDVRVGMARILPAAPILSTNTGTVTGTLPAALTTFDGDTSRVTYTAGSGQSTVLNAAGLSAIPSGAVIHAIKLTASGSGDAGPADGRMFVETAAGRAATELLLAFTYAPTSVVLSEDPATLAPFSATELAAGTVTIGIEEG